MSIDCISWRSIDCRNNDFFYCTKLLKLGAMANTHIMDHDLLLLRYFLIITIVKLQYIDQ